MQSRNATLQSLLEQSRMDRASAEGRRRNSEAQSHTLLQQIRCLQDQLKDSQEQLGVSELSLWDASDENEKLALEWRHVRKLQEESARGSYTLNLTREKLKSSCMLNESYRKQCVFLQAQAKSANETEESARKEAEERAERERGFSFTPVTWWTKNDVEPRPSTQAEPEATAAAVKQAEEEVVATQAVEAAAAAAKQAEEETAAKQAAEAAAAAAAKRAEEEEAAAKQAATSAAATAAAEQEAAAVAVAVATVWTETMAAAAALACSDEHDDAIEAAQDEVMAGVREMGLTPEQLAQAELIHQAGQEERKRVRAQGRAQVHKLVDTHLSLIHI